MPTRATAPRRATLSCSCCTARTVAPHGRTAAGQLTASAPYSFPLLTFRRSVCSAYNLMSPSFAQIQAAASNLSRITSGRFGKRQGGDFEESCHAVRAKVDAGRGVVALHSKRTARTTYTLLTMSTRPATVPALRTSRRPYSPCSQRLCRYVVPMRYVPASELSDRADLVWVEASAYIAAIRSDVPSSRLSIHVSPRLTSKQCDTKAAHPFGSFGFPTAEPKSGGSKSEHASNQPGSPDPRA